MRKLYSIARIAPIALGAVMVAALGAKAQQIINPVTTNTPLTSHALVVGGAGKLVRPIGSLGSTTTVLHGGGSGDPTWGSVLLSTDVSGLLPLGNLGGAVNGDCITGSGGVWQALACPAGTAAVTNRITTGTTNTLSSITTPFTTELWVSATSGAKTDNVPGCVSGLNNDFLIENDGQGTAGTNPITVTPATGTIEGGASYTITVNNGPVFFQCDGTATQWRVVALGYSGAAVRSNTTTSLSIGASDNGNVISQSNASAVAATIAQAGSAGFAEGGYQTIVQNTGAGAITVTPTTSTINGQSTLVIPPGSQTFPTGEFIFADLTGNYIGVPFSSKGTPLATGASTGNTLAGPSGYFVCTAACTVTPPVPVAGYQFCVMNDDNVTTAITLGALGGSAMYENTARTAYGTAGTGTLTSGSGTAGNMVCIVGRDATHYLTTTFVGTWTAS